MKSIWLGNLKNDERENFKQSILISKNVLDKLKEIVYNMANEKESVVSYDYDSPSWSHKQAHNNGFLDACRKIIEIVDVKE